MKRHIELLHSRVIFEHFIFRIEEAEFRHGCFDGSIGAPITRVVLKRGDSVAVLPHDPNAGVVLLCEQFRAPTAERGPGWLVEIPAGMVEKGETVEASARRETREETGHEVDALTTISTVFPSPGLSSERIHIFYGRIALRLNLPVTAGVVNEGEDIRVLRLPVDEALARLRAGAIQDAKTMIALQWLELAMARSEVLVSPKSR